MIQKLIDSTILSLPIIYQNGHQEIKYSFQQNPELHLLKIYNKKANKPNITKKNTTNLFLKTFYIQFQISFQR